MDIGFVGAGKMGLPIAINIATKGPEQVRLFDAQTVTFPEGTDTSNITVVPSLADLAECTTVVLCLPDSGIVSAVIEGHDGAPGLATMLGTGSTIVDCGSSLPAETTRLAKALAERDIALFDAPVSGGLPKAWSGQLTVLSGGHDQASDSIKDILARFGSNILPFARVGDGHVIKTANNYLLATNMLACMEALSFAVASGVSVSEFETAINGSSGRSYVSEIKLPLVENPDAPIGFTTGLIRKDVENFMASIAAAGLTPPLPEHVLAGWKDAETSIGSNSDSMRVYDYLKNLNAASLT